MTQPRPLVPAKFISAAQLPLPDKIRAALRSAKLPVPVILYILTVIIPIGFSLGPLAMSLLRGYLLVMTLPLLGMLLGGRAGRLILTDWLFFLHVIWMAVALWMKSPDQMVLQVGSVGMEFIGGYLIGRIYIRSTADFMALCRFLTFVVLCMAPFAFFETLTGKAPLLDLLQKAGISNVRHASAEKRMGLERVQMVFAHPIHFGLFCSVAFSLTIVGLRGIVPDTRRILMATLIGASGFLALSSGALLAIVLQIALISWALLLAGVAKRWWVLFGLFCVAYVAIDLLSNRSPIRVFMSYATFSAHNAYWRSIIFEWGMINVWGSPIFGIGMNDWVRPVYMYSGSMDNFWLVIAVRFGIPGFLLLAVGYAVSIGKIIWRDFESDPVLARQRRAWAFTMLGLSFTLVTVHVWSSIYSFVFFIFGAGMWMLSAKPDQTGAPAPETEAPRGTRYSRFSPVRRRVSQVTVRE